MIDTFQSAVHNTPCLPHWVRDRESIDAYVTDLHNKAARCEFGVLKDGLICDWIVCGINDDSASPTSKRSRTDLGGLP